jgi:hypothetical protein
VYVQEEHTHRPEKTISKNTKNSEKNYTNLPWKNQSGEKHNQQEVQLHEPWDAKLEELKNPANLMRNSFLESSSTCDFRA